MVDSDYTSSISESKILVLLVFVLVIFRVVNAFLQKQATNVASALIKNVTIVVLGDIGRSPRMQYHALSFAQNGWKVDLVGYDGSKPLTSITNNQNINVHYISHPWHLPDNIPKLLFFVYAPIKVYIQILFLYWTLFVRINRPTYILVQNPPSIPTLMIVQFVCWARQTDLIIDWHNFGYTILGIRLGHNSRIVKIAKWYEKLYGRRAHAHLTVTAAMHRELMYKWEVQGAISTLYDRPQSHFKKLDLEEIHEFLTRFDLEEIISKQSIGANFLPPSSTTSTLLTTKPSPDTPAKYRSDRPILIVSSTSWTADEDFSILLKAAEQYDQAADKTSQNKFPKLVFIITGKGPLKDMYEREISKISLKNVRIVTAWLSAEDYPLILGCADLGISLHKSSSGMDLPMKVVDMFGCGLPVCAIKFDCIGELVQHNKNGLIFNNEEELARQLIVNYPANASKIESMRKHVDEFQKERWDTNWNRVVLPLLTI
ncbi:4822_t:CDS:2 [Dentiscutata erythropus]|uniref:Chitobiosyldiphosphodolichol beta-mannosyltransferase n=1 Tax=Dentiscutata erythropus TaxID=1348616 RepID=A0A9N9BV11_9GLOM|nr:4822_t:CDS:2 [Dentiscutata erythropus]